MTFRRTARPTSTPHGDLSLYHGPKPVESWASVKARLAEERARALHKALRAAWDSNRQLHAEVDALKSLLHRVNQTFMIGDGGGVFLMDDVKKVYALMREISDTDGRKKD